MQLNDDVYVLALEFARAGQVVDLNLTLVLDGTQGPTLIDAGLPGQREAIAAALGRIPPTTRDSGWDVRSRGGIRLGGMGVQVQDLRRIIVTHQDIDHVGSLHDLVEASGARVLAHEVEAPFIDGRQPPRFATPEMLARRPELRPLVERFRPTPVDETLQDGTRLDLAGGVRAIFTPGHTPGHACLYLERTGTLIAGDTLTASEGRLQGPNANATPDMAGASRSVQKLADLDLQAIVCYHGGVVLDDPGGQVRRVAEELAG